MPMNPTFGSLCEGAALILIIRYNFSLMKGFYNAKTITGRWLYKYRNEIAAISITLGLGHLLICDLLHVNNWFLKRLPVTLAGVLGVIVIYVGAREKRLSDRAAIS
jgi:hypothetical protein